MSLKLLKTALAATVVSLGAMTFGSSASASTFQSCALDTPDVTNNILVNVGCEVMLDPNNDSESALNMGAGMFGITSWNLLERDNADDGEIPDSNGVLTTTGTTLGGTWSIASSVFDTWETVLMVFKGGTNADPDAVVGYLINSLTGTWSSPFYDNEGVDANGDTIWKQKDTSHITLYGAERCDPLNGNPCDPPVTEVPIPAGLPLMLTGLAAAGFVARRRKS